MAFAIPHEMIASSNASSTSVMASAASGPGVMDTPRITHGLEPSVSTNPAGTSNAHPDPGNEFATFPNIDVEFPYLAERHFRGL